MKLSKPQFVEVRPNIWLSKSDPNYYRKFLMYHPNDKEALYQYGKKLLEKGNIVDGINHLEKSSSLGHTPSKEYLTDFKKPAVSFPSHQEIKKRNSTYPLLLPILLIFFVIAFLLFLMFTTFYFISNKYVYEQNEYHYKHSEHYQSTDQEEKPVALTTEKEFKQIVFLNAAKRYKEQTGTLPDDTIQLTAKTNQESGKFISDLPQQPNNYENEPLQIAFYNASFDGSIPNSHLLELHFFPEENKLSLVRGNGETLVVYPVAAGKELLPFSSSQVSERVVNPNGGNGPLGTRGLVLTSNFAIHGTDNPDTIGEKVTMGCIRMFNTDIEELYPFISVGTPFEVKNGEPGTPTFAKGLPPIQIPPDSLKEEENPSTNYLWKK